VWGEPHTGFFTRNEPAQWDKTEELSVMTMQRISLLLNVLLIACLAVTVTTRRKEAQVSFLSAQPSPQAGADKGEGRTLTRGSAEVQPFRWNQIESPDYRVYVANLRAIGCPERTVRDIIHADVGSLFAAKRKEQLPGEQAVVGKWSREEESRLIASLLGDASEEAVRRVERFTPAAAVLPLVLRPVDVAALGLSDEQKAAIEELRDQFITDVGGVGQDPNDPAYGSRWQTAQPQSDIMLRGMIGGPAFMRYQLEADD
jgi:hypothetical protein